MELNIALMKPVGAMAPVLIIIITGHFLMCPNIASHYNSMQVGKYWSVPVCPVTQAVA